MKGLARQSGDDRFAVDSYRRLLQMFGTTVLGMDGDVFADLLDDAQAAAAARPTTPTLDVDDLTALVEEFKVAIREHTGSDFPQDPVEQLRHAIRAVFESWNTPRAALYRRQEQIPDDLGTAVNVQAMVFGNHGDHSGSGVCFTRDPASGDQGVYGDYLQNAQGEDVVAGIRNTIPLARPRRLDPASYEQLLRIMARSSCTTATCATSSSPSRTAGSGCSRPGSASAPRRRRSGSPCAMVDEGLIDLDEALLRVTGQQLASLLFPRFAPDPERHAVDQRHERLPGRRRRPSRPRLGHRESPGPRAARTSSWSARRRRPTTCPA